MRHVQSADQRAGAIAPGNRLLTRSLLSLPLWMIALTAWADFHFIALGDTAYNGDRDYPVYERLIDRINADRPAFSIHVGDIWGAGSCADWHVERIAGFFDRFKAPLIYTPGDNEWVDCANPGMGGFPPEARLAELRKVFFDKPRSLGQQSLALTRQGDLSEPYARFVENVRWAKENVLFVTANVPGSRNGVDYRNAASLAAFTERNAAVRTWLNDSFRLAADGDMAAVVVALHAELFDSDPSPQGPYGDVLRAIRNGAERFGRPVLLIHGDFHRFVIDRPFLEERGEADLPRYANITRLQVYGAPEIRAVRVTVAPATPWVFGFQPLYDQ